MSSQYFFCKLPQHLNEKILGLCFNSACSENPEYCYLCKIKGNHQKHQNECSSFLDLRSKLIDIKTILNEQKKSFQQLLNEIKKCLTDLFNEIFSKQLDDCDQLIEIIKIADCNASKKNLSQLNMFRALEKENIMSRIVTIKQKCSSFLTHLNETQTDQPIQPSDNQIMNQSQEQIVNNNESKFIIQEKSILQNINEQQLQQICLASENNENVQEYNDDAYLEFVMKELENETQIQNIQESEQLYFEAQKNLQDQQLALSYLDKAIQLFPYNEEAILLKGKILHKQQKYQESIKYFERVLEDNPKSAEVNYLYACILNKMGNYQEAIKLCDQAISLDKENHSAYNNKAFSLIKVSRNAEALENYDLAIKYNPYLGDYQTNKGNLLLKMNRISDAIICKEKIDQLNTRTVVSFQFISQLLIYQGKKAEAISILKQGLSYFPNDQQLLQSLEQLQSYYG